MGVFFLRNKFNGDRLFLVPSTDTCSKTFKIGHIAKFLKLDEILLNVEHVREPYLMVW